MCRAAGSGSGGAPSGLQLAIRHPDRVSALILTVPRLTPLAIGEIGDGEFEWPSDFAQTIQNMALFASSEMLVSSLIPNLDESDPTQLTLARAFMRSVMPASQRRAGQENDIRQFSRLDVSKWPLEEVFVPTLILHGGADENTPYEGSVAAAARMPNAELVTFEGEDHFMMITQSHKVDEHISRFLSELGLATDE